MVSPETALIVDKDGLRGTAKVHELRHEDTDRVFIQLENGRTVLVEKRLLQGQRDGSYYLPLSLTDVQETQVRSSDELVLPVIAEEIEVHKRTVDKPRVRISKTVQERDVIVDEPLMQEHVEVNRVVVNRMVDEPPAIRYEGSTMIVPVLEEVVVVEVRLMVREELHIIRSREEAHKAEHVVLRREEVEVEMLNDDAQVDSHQSQ